MENDFDIDKVLKQPLLAHLATSSDKGVRHSDVWFLWEENILWLIGNARNSIPKKIKKPSCSIGIVYFDLPKGILKQVGFRGKAVVVPLEQDRLYRLLSLYLGDNKDEWNQWFKKGGIDNSELMIKFVPENTVVRDQSYFLL